MKRLAYGTEHAEFREMAAAFVAAEVTPNPAARDAAGPTGRAVYEAAGAARSCSAGTGVMTEYPVARAVLDGRASTIYAGSTEITKLIVSRSLGR